MKQTIKPYKRDINFKDKNGNLAEIDIEITHKNGYPELSMCGDYEGGSGQCDGHIEPDNDAQAELLSMWREWHLNGMTSGTPEQEELILKGLKDKTLKNTEYELICEYLKKHKKYTVDWKGKKHRYGFQKAGLG